LESYIAVAALSAAVAEQISEVLPETYPGIEGTQQEKELLEESLRLLQNSGVEAGEKAVEAIRDKGCTICFGATGAGAIAQYDPESNKIVINEDLKDALPRIIAAHLI